MHSVTTGCETERGWGGGGGRFEFANRAMGEWLRR